MIGSGRFAVPARALGLAYGWTLLTPSPVAGLCFLLVTWLDPARGAAGLLGAVAALACAGWQRHDANLLPVHGFNGLLTGLLLGGLLPASAASAGLVLAGGGLASLLTQAAGAAVWQVLRLPVLSLPFVLAGWLLIPALSGASSHASAALPVAGGGTDRFLTAVGSILMQPQPMAGLLFLACITAASRLLALLALAGYAVTLLLAGLPGFAAAGYSAGFNAILTAMALGGLFAAPGWGSLLLALSGSALAMLLDAALTRLTGYAGLMPLSLPFVLATGLCLHAARQAGAPRVQPEHPQLPERSLETRNMALARVGEDGTLPLMLPVNGEWEVYQAFDGEHTHQGLWRHAIDLIVTEGGRSFHGDGSELTQYYAFGLPVLSPCHGQVAAVVADVPDNAPGGMDLERNWGNHVLLRLADGACVLLAHLRQGSIGVSPGDWLRPGDPVGQCGSSGRSPQPHLHLSVVSYAHPAAPTLPFHLCGINRIGSGVRQFRLNHAPQAGDRLENAWGGAVQPMPVLAGHSLHYVSESGQAAALGVVATLDGRLRITGRGSAAVRADNTPSVLACYEREGGRDRFLDLWLLAAGFTPASEKVSGWLDRPPVRLLPPSVWRGLAFLCPGLVSLRSRYVRHWDDSVRAWLQEGEHVLFGRVRLRTRAWLSPEHGLVRLETRQGARRTLWRLTGARRQGDAGIPAYSVDFHAATGDTP